MHLTLTSSEIAVPLDRFTQILKLCQADKPSTDFTPARTTSLKLDLRAIQEVELMEGYATEEDFDELLFVPKVQDFLSKIHHNEQENQAFWLLLRIRYLALLRRPERAQVIQTSDHIQCKSALLVPEVFRLSKVAERIRLLSRLSYRDFAALMGETDQRELALNADGGVFLSAIAFDKQNSELQQSVRRTFLAR